jgi:hypothetical protein
MSEHTNGTTNGNATGAAAGRTEANGTADKTPLYASEAEAQQHAPTGEAAGKLSLLVVTAPGKDAVYLWGDYTTTALCALARAHGYKSAKVGKPVAKEEVGAMLSRLSPEDRAVLIAQYVPAPAPKGSKK